MVAPSQKGIVGMLMRESDMPFSKEGLRPDLLFNPSGIPSRTTVGQLIESTTSTLCAVKGTHYDGTLLTPIDIDAVKTELGNYGYNCEGYDRLYSGMTGEHIDVAIFIGPTYYQRLQKFIDDSNYSVKRANIDITTRQPIDGQSSSGGLRIGEMEHDVLAVHGGARTITEKFHNHSDGFTEYICKRCGTPAIVNLEKNKFVCKLCNDSADIGKLNTSWTAKLFRQYASAMGVGITINAKPIITERPDNGEVMKLDLYNDDAKKQLKRAIVTVNEEIDDEGE